ncbi:hypothetical protein HW132_03850 [Brasilonema sp. CT11]|nr:hypothetical protein [Brasilonema sp. CT11]
MLAERAVGCDWRTRRVQDVSLAQIVDSFSADKFHPRARAIALINL